MYENHWDKAVKQERARHVQSFVVYYTKHVRQKEEKRHSCLRDDTKLRIFDHLLDELEAKEIIDIFSSGMYVRFMYRRFQAGTKNVRRLSVLALIYDPCVPYSWFPGISTGMDILTLAPFRKDVQVLFFRYEKTPPRCGKHIYQFLERSKKDE